MQLLNFGYFKIIRRRAILTGVLAHSIQETYKSQEML